MLKKEDYTDNTWETVPLIGGTHSTYHGERFCGVVFFRTKETQKKLVLRFRVQLDFTCNNNYSNVKQTLY